jgi:hypothetical protein
MEYWLAAIVYGKDYLLLVFLWPLLTIWNVLSDLLGFTHEED